MKTSLDGAAGKELKSFIERVERLAEKEKGIKDDKREVYAEMKGRGFDTKTVRKIVAARKKSADERAEEAAILDLYWKSIGGVFG